METATELLPGDCDRAARARRPVFRHKPLDHTLQSLRLLHLKPKLSSDGLIQCTITQTTTRARYTCLSYRWGEPDISKQRSILINGCLHPVRENLFDFLRLMQSTAPRDDSIFDSVTGYWIDALCINQDNTEEKNHQVAQMGLIYSCAEKVHVWLGTIPEPLPEPFQQLIYSRDASSGFYHDYDNRPGLTELEDWTVDPGHRSLLHWASFDESDLDFIFLHVLRNEYWTRAWVVQEMLLAQHVDISLNDRRIPLPAFFKRLREGSIDWSNTPLQAFSFQVEGRIVYRGQSLIKLMEHFRGVKCSLVHDRAFALLSLCDNDKTVPVCYEDSVDELAHRIISSEPVCICSARSVAQSLDLGTTDGSRSPGERGLFLEFDLYPPKMPRTPPVRLWGGYDYTLEWTDPARHRRLFSCKRPGLSLKRGMDQYFVLKEWGGPNLSFKMRSMYRKEPSECMDKWCARFCEQILKHTDLEAMLYFDCTGTDKIFSFDIPTVLQMSFTRHEVAVPLPNGLKRISPNWMYRISEDRSLLTVRIPVGRTLGIPEYLDDLCSNTPLHFDRTPLVRLLHY